MGARRDSGSEQWTALPGVSAPLDWTVLHFVPQSSLWCSVPPPTELHGHQMSREHPKGCGDRNTWTSWHQGIRALFCANSGLWICVVKTIFNAKNYNNISSNQGWIRNQSTAQGPLLSRAPEAPHLLHMSASFDCKYVRNLHQSKAEITMGPPSGCVEGFII